MKTKTSRRKLLTAAVTGGALLEAPQGALAQRPATVAAAPPAQVLNGLIWGLRNSQMIAVAAKLRIADRLADGPKTAAELAAATKTHADSLYRLMRTLGSLGVFVEEEGQRFRLNAVSELLRTGVPGSVRAEAEVTGSDWMWRSWGALDHSVKTGEVAFEHLYGENTFQWFAKHPEAAQLFNDFMDARSNPELQAIIGLYDFTSTKKVVDVGGSHGVLLEAILRVNPTARAVLFDLPHVVESARKRLGPEMARRSDLVGGDFFKSIPAGGDLYILKNILHDWDELRCVKILETCHRAMPGQSKLLVIEAIVCGPNQPCVAKVTDVMMLVRTGGRNRTEQEYKDILAKGKFQLTKIHGNPRGSAVIEAVPL